MRAAMNSQREMFAKREVGMWTEAPVRDTLGAPVQGQLEALDPDDLRAVELLAARQKNDRTVSDTNQKQSHQHRMPSWPPSTQGNCISRTQWTPTPSWHLSVVTAFQPNTSIPNSHESVLYQRARR